MCFPCSGVASNSEVEHGLMLRLRCCVQVLRRGCFWRVALRYNRFRPALLVVVPLALALCGCDAGKAKRGYAVATGGSAERGVQVIEHYKCGQCHTIPGIHGAHGVFGPPLIEMGNRTMIAGNFPNVPENLVHWVKAPTSMKPKTAMPDLGLSDQQARDVAAYLESLR